MVYAAALFQSWPLFDKARMNLRVNSLFHLADDRGSQRYSARLQLPTMEREVEILAWIVRESNIGTWRRKERFTGALWEMQAATKYWVVTSAPPFPTAPRWSPLFPTVPTAPGCFSYPTAATTRTNSSDCDARPTVDLNFFLLQEVLNLDGNKLCGGKFGLRSYCSPTKCALLWFLLHKH